MEEEEEEEEEENDEDFASPSRGAGDEDDVSLVDIGRAVEAIPASREDSDSDASSAPSRSSLVGDCDGRDRFDLVLPIVPFLRCDRQVDMQPIL